ncbi:hypothetical protein CMO83_02270 [Candidatus Woesearchaeota archaeon]|jgi:uncharacterized membrane protein|nr:hypothetical protein [Candidatus Woesearchaeota archaeon]|tara:strand:+ start:10958 stop:11659 length:702 start_codon:yes stop_codon:yes gene_type:complete
MYKPRYKPRILIYLFISIFLISLVNAVTIHGTIYDFSLKKLNNVRVEIDTSPKQFIVAQNGTYSFNVPNGDYTIKAQLIQKNTVLASVEENITVSRDGSYVLDLILFPDIEEGIEEIELDVNGDIIEEDNNIILTGFIILLILIVVIGVYYFNKNKKRKVKTEEPKEKYEDVDLGQLIKIIKQEGGRTTQKDIRKQIPLSEAKISLMIAELEHKGIIEKIKKGRGNIIILKRK